MASSRLRRTFHYPSESDDEDAVEAGMDEQDQSQLLATLASHDTSRTRIYTLVLCALPLAPALFHAPLLLRTQTAIPSLLATASLLASAHALYFVPLPPVTVGVMRPSELGNKKYASGTSAQAISASHRRRVPHLPDELAAQLAKYIVPANAAFCVLLAVLELVQGRSWSEGVVVGGGYLPGVVFGVVLWARRELRVMDMSELEKLKIGGGAKET